LGVKNGDKSRAKRHFVIAPKRVVEKNSVVGGEISISEQQNDPARSPLMMDIRV
jgi:hypothetical protein